MVTTISWDNITTETESVYDGNFSTLGASSSENTTVSQTIELPTPVYIFDERNNDNIRVAQSNYVKKKGNSSYISFSIGYVGELISDSAVRYIDINGITLLDGKIKTLKETYKDINSEKRIYDVMIYDYGYNLEEGNINKNFEEQYAEARIEEVVTENDLNFINLLTTSTTVTLEKRTYQDKKPIDLINSLCDALGATWRINENTFYLFREGDFNSSEEIDGTNDWIISDGWTDDTTEKADKVVVRGATITQTATENFTGSFTEITLARTPVDIEIDGLTQTTTSIDGDFDVIDKVITFDSAQTDPEIKYSYESQLRVEVGDSGITKVLSKTYITSLSEARRLGRNYLSIYNDGISSSNWQSINFDYDVTNFNCGEVIDVKNRYATNRDGDYLISQVKRQYPKKIIISVGENEVSLYNWQKESKERIEELETTSDNSDFITKDVYKQIGISADFEVSLSKLYSIEDSGNILWASDTTLASDGDLISDTGIDDDFALAYDESDVILLDECIDYLD